MKIGILTYHRTHNYGGCLQALATRIILEQMGHDVFYVDYWPDYHKHIYDIFNPSLFKEHRLPGKIKYLIQIIRRYPYLRKRQCNFQIFLDEFIIPYCRPITETYDVVVYGSDQIWRVQKALCDYNPEYFADNNINANLHIAFSASMGVLPKSEEERLKVKRLLSHFNAISVRETNLLNFVHELGYNNAVQTIDPTLLLDAQAWNSTFPTPTYSGEKYILVYILRPHHFDLNSINRFAEREGLMVKILTGSAIKAETNQVITTAGPHTFISLVKNADYVFTSSFHGLAFSLIFHKQVFASCKENGERLSGLLEQVGLSDRFITAESHNIKYDNLIDYSLVEQRLAAIKETSIEYLTMNINHINSL